MKKNISAWLSLFRLPNLPTAPGDALAGAAICLSLSHPGTALSIEPDALLKLLAAGGAALLLYMAGLADNDIVGAEEDRTHAPKRPIPAGDISIPQAQVARAVCLILTVVGSALCRMPAAWWIVAAILVGGIFFYNRFKNKWPVFGLVSMGFCRGLSLLAGAAAMWNVSAPADASLLDHTLFSRAVLMAVIGWTAYISAVTWLAVDEHAARDPMPTYRFLPGLAVFIPMLALADYPSWAWPLIIVCSACAYGVWGLSVWPLGKVHTPEQRRRAVGGTIGAVLYLQAAYILSFPHVVLATIVFALFISTTFIRRFFDQVQGS